MARLKTNGVGVKGAEIAKNDLDITENTLVAIKGGFADKAVAGDAVVGISRQTKVFTSDNETVAEAKLTYYGLDDNSEFEELVEGGTIAQADVHALFDLNANGKVDGATSGAGTQVKLIKVITDTKGVFTRA